MKMLTDLLSRPSPTIAGGDMYIYIYFIIILESKKKVEKKVGRLLEARGAPP